LHLCAPAFLRSFFTPCAYGALLARWVKGQAAIQVAHEAPFSIQNA
jgi:hypothetical protein